MAPTVTKVKSAFGFYQAKNLKLIRDELGEGTTMGSAMTELSQRWKSLSQTDKQPYFDLEASDRLRFQQESAAADAEAARIQLERRQKLVAKEGESSSSRGARARVANERAEAEEERQRRKRKREEEMDPEELERRRKAKEEKKRATLERQRKREAEEKKLQAKQNKLNKDASKTAAKRLEYLLQQSDIFGKLNKAGHSSQQGAGADDDGKESKDEDGDADYVPHQGKGRPKKKSKAVETPAEGEEENDENESSDYVFLTKQPKCIKFGTLKPYQLEGLNWMIHLAEKGLNGILADEMGLGKTLQSISILAYHYEFQNCQGPHLICVPKSTLSNWMNELARWCPSLRAIKFHGTKEERNEIIQTYFTNAAAAHHGNRPSDRVRNQQTGQWEDDNSNNPRQFDVCVTTYEVCNTERQAIGKFTWKYLVIDEAHRLKNEASMFSKTVRTFLTSHRLLLTGTPLQNNLHELWALLNFLLPDIFSDSDQFDEWFDLEIDDQDAKKDMISQLHKILRPFMLRRLKADVAKGLPPKTETLVMVGMSSMQKKLYKNLLLRDIDNLTGSANKNRTAILNIVMQLRKCCGHPYLFEGVEDRTLDPLGEHLVTNCGKLFMVDKLLKKLKERGSRVLIFTQMTRILDILEDYLIMRGYKYCRIDGNTEYDVRESSIAAFNAPNSEKFCFILSTRAGGLGINLQTADTCILYDSDWNPQADLQAQDRCHRLGQKKPVSVYRLVSENTVEEKIVERAQQKLKLDAMVVQQGRLKEKDKVSKEEVMAAIRFGADTVFRSEESTITDDDIDVILERGKAKTKELTEKIQKAEKGDMLDFRMDGGISAQTFEGIDYSDKDLRDQLKLLAANSLGKRERRKPPVNAAPVTQPKVTMVINSKKIKLPMILRLPRMEDHQFYNRQRLEDLDKIEFQTFANLKQLGQLPTREVMEKKKTLLPEEYAAEKLELLAEGFGEWTKTQYYAFVKASAKYGREDFSNIAIEIDMPIESVRAYSNAFWSYGETDLKKEEWEKVKSMIEKGEARIEKRKKLSHLLKKFINTFDDARTQMTFANRGTTHFSLPQDRALLCSVDKYGYGNWDRVREEIMNDDQLMMQHIVQGMNTDAISKRCDYRMRQMEKELEARERKMNEAKSANLIAAENTIRAIKEFDEFDAHATSLQMKGHNRPSHQHLSREACQMMEERLRDRQAAVDRLREIELQLRGCRELENQTKEAIKRGDQYVNYSHITLKAGGQHITRNGLLANLDGVDLETYIGPAILSVPECGSCPSCKDVNITKLCVKRMEMRTKMIAEYDEKMKEKAAKLPQLNVPEENGGKDKKENAKPGPKKRSIEESSRGDAVDPANSDSIAAKKKISPPGNPLGNKRMAVPDELLPDFCRRIGANGTRKRMDTINDFVKAHPAVSIRQVTFKFAEISTKDRPACVPMPEKPKGKGRAFTFYLRPRFYHLLPPDERPPEWEKYSKEDEVLWKEECAKLVEETKAKEEQMKSMMKKSPSKASLASLSSNPETSLSLGDVTMNGDDSEQANKKAKIEA